MDVLAVFLCHTDYTDIYRLFRIASLTMGVGGN